MNSKPVKSFTFVLFLRFFRFQSLCWLFTLSLLPQQGFSYVPLDAETYLKKNIKLSGNVWDLLTQPKNRQWFKNNQPPVAINLFLANESNSLAYSLTSLLQAEHSNLANFLNDVQWTEGTELITLTHFFLTHPEQAVFFNQQPNISAHTTGNPVHAGSPLVLLMLAMQAHPFAELDQLYQIAPELTLLILDANIQLLEDTGIINNLISHPSISHFLNFLQAVQNHQPGSSSEVYSYIFINLQVLFTLPKSFLQVVESHIHDHGFYMSLMRYMHHDYFSDATARLNQEQFRVLIQNVRLLKFIQSVTTTIKLNKGELALFIKALTGHFLNTTDSPNALSNQELMLIVARRLHNANRFSSLSNAPLTDLVNACTFPEIFTAVNTDYIILFLLGHFQNVLAYITGNHAYFANIDASHILTNLQLQAIRDRSGATELLQSAINDPSRIMHLSPATDVYVEQDLNAQMVLPSSNRLRIPGSDALVVISGQNAPSTISHLRNYDSGALTVDTSYVPPTPEIEPTYSPLICLGSNEPTSPLTVNALTLLHTQELLLASQHLPSSHPVMNIVFELIYHFEIPISESERFYQRLKSLLEQLDMLAPENYNRTHFILLLIAQFAQEEHFPFAYVNHELINSRYPELIAAIRQYLESLHILPEETLQNTSVAIFHLISSYPELFSSLGTPQLMPPSTTNSHLGQLLTAGFTPAQLPQVIELLVVQPGLLSTAMIAANGQASLQNLTSMASQIGTEQLAQLSGIQLFLIHAMLVSHNFPPISLSSFDPFVIQFLKQLIQAELLPLIPQTIAFVPEMLIAYLLDQVPELEHAMSMETVLNILSRYYR